LADEIKMDRKTFESLASETRIAILKSLDARQMTITELSKNLGLAKSTVHEHLAKMADAGLVEKIEDHRKWSYYKLTYKGKGILHPHEMVRIMLLLSFAFLALTGGAFEIINYRRYLAPGARQMAAQTELAEEAVEKASPMVLAEPSYTALLLGVLLLIIAVALGFTAFKRWRSFRS